MSGQEPKKDQDDSSTDDEFLFIIVSHLTKFPVVINNVPSNVMIDSGSSMNIINQGLYDKMEPKPTVLPYLKNVYAYNTSSPLPVEGYVLTSITENGQTKSLQLIKNAELIILGHHHTAVALDLLRVEYENTRAWTFYCVD